MKLELNQLRDFRNKNVYFQFITSPVNVSHAGLKIVNQYNLPIRVESIGATVIKCTILPIAGLQQEVVNLLLRNFNHKWALFSEYGEMLSNIDRQTCFRCGGFTELRRDFLTFALRLFCPRCHI